MVCFIENKSHGGVKKAGRELDLDSNNSNGEDKTRQIVSVSEDGISLQKEANESNRNNRIFK